MKKLVSFSILIIFIFCSLNVSAQWNKSVKGSGHVTKKDHNISNIEGLKIGGVFNIFITQDSEETLTIEADDNLHELIEVKNKNGVLHISTTGSINNSKEMTVHLTIKNLKEMDFSGATTVVSTEPLSFKALEVFCSGASDIELEIEVENLELDLSGASNLDLTGKVRHAEIDVSGASELDAKKLSIREAHLDASGASHADIYVTQSIDASASGSSSVSYSGDPEKIEVKESAASSIHHNKH